MRVGDQRHALVAYPRYPLYNRLDGPHGRSGRVRNASTPTGIQSPGCLACSKFDESLSKITGSLHEDLCTYRFADESLARAGRKQATATEDFDIHIYYL